MTRISRQEKQSKLPLGRAIIVILLSTLLISGSAGLGMLYYQQIRELRTRDSKYQITSIVQTGPEQNQLKTDTIAKIMELESENLYLFSASEARENLLRSPFVKEAKVKKVPPGTIYVDYVLRKPIAILGDFSNTLLDEEAVSFPKTPFFDQESYPEIILGLNELKWGEEIRGRRLGLALQLYRELSSSSLTLIDVSRAFAPSYGDRQIVVGLGSHILRLSTKNYRQELQNYRRLMSYFEDHSEFQKDLVIDLRIPQLGFITKS